MTDDPVHIHFGPGNIGSGLILASRTEAAPEIHVCGRTTSPFGQALAHALSVPVAVGDGTERHIPFDAFHALDDAGWSTIEGLLLANRPILVTTALGEGQSEVGGPLSEILARRLAARIEAPLLLLPCENRVHESLEACPTVTCGVVVDRLCRRSDDGHMVITEAYSDWAVSLPPGLPERTRQTMEQLIEAIGARVVSNEFEFLKRRKLLLMNTVHSAFAFIANDYGYSMLNEFAQDAGAEHALIALARECATILAREYPSKGQEIRQHSNTCVRRIKAFPDTAGRVLKRLLTMGPGSRAEQLTYLADRLAEPLDQLIQFSNGNEDDYVLGQAYRVACEVVFLS